jgi:conjugative relaxase-like TrwC/TraI family protein
VWIRFLPRSPSFHSFTGDLQSDFSRCVVKCAVTQSGDAEHRAGWDATFSAPKSVSLTALVGGDDRVREAHRESVRVALRELERYTQARIGNLHAPETTGKFIAATFEHDTARPVDSYAAPQLHTHAVIFNMTERENGSENGKQMRVLQPHEMFVSPRYIIAVYRSELALRLEKLGYEPERGKHEQPEIRDYTKEYLEASSPRREQIKDHLREEGIDGAAAAQIAAHHTRDRKELLSPEEVLQRHRELAAQHGHQADRIVAQARERGQYQPREPEMQAQRAVTWARDHVFERDYRIAAPSLKQRWCAAWEKRRMPESGRSSSAESKPGNSAKSRTLALADGTRPRDGPHGA